MVRRKRSILVSDVDGSSVHVHTRLGPNCRTTSYVAAPIMPEGEVIGFVHADCYFHGRDVDELDRDILMIFAEGLGYILARTILVEQLNSLQSDLRLLTRRVSAAAAGSLSTPTSEPRLHAVRELTRSPHPSSPQRAYVLTERERDIMRLVAGGATNTQVARRLVLSEGTVKWHVKNILRKLGVPNRAAAVSHWLAAQQNSAS